MKNHRFATFAAIFIATLLSACASLKPSSDLQFHTNDVYKSTGYPFSEAVEVEGWVFLSGALGTLPGKAELAPGGIEGEGRQVMENIKASLERLGLGMDRVVKCTVMIDDMDDWPVFNEIYKEFFPDGNYPARSAFGADGLGLGAALEVECLAKR